MISIIFIGLRNTDLYAVVSTRSKKTNEPIENLWVKELGEVHDGDTFRATVHGRANECPIMKYGRLWRIAGIDAPEINPSVKLRDSKKPNDRARYKQLKDMAIKAQVFLSEKLKKADKILLCKPCEEKYAGRLLCRVLLEGIDDDAHDVAKLMLAAGHAQPYDGGTKSEWL